MPSTVYSAAIDLGATSGRVILGKWAHHRLTLTEVHRFPNTFRTLGAHDYWDLGTLWHEAQTGLRKAANRIQLKRKNPRAFEDFGRRFMLHSAQGCAKISRRVQGRRPSLLSMERSLRALKVPAHVIVGDEDPGAIDSGIFMKRVSPAVRLGDAVQLG